MSDPLPLPRRARRILYAVVTEYIATGEPVASRTLARKYDEELSAATIRTVLADLEDAGYLAQPHTSAGRVPTEAAYRLFIDALMQVRDVGREERERLAELGELPPGVDLMRHAGRLLSDLTGAAAVVLRPRGTERTLLRVRFIPTRPGELLAVLVMSDGTVENRFIAVDLPLEPPELERLHRLLEEHAEGRTLVALRDHLRGHADARRGELAVLQGLGARLLGAALEGMDRSAEVLIEGRARLLEHQDFRDGQALRDLLAALEDSERLVGLLDRALQSARVQVFLGSETDSVAGPVSVVAAPYRDEGGQPGGAVGIIGPTRMDYPVVVPLVGAAAGAVSAALSRGRGGHDPDH